ncbi:MAG: dienelactone hydrolase family protein [Chitinophagaceae bacterium]
MIKKSFYAALFMAGAVVASCNNEAATETAKVSGELPSQAKAMDIKEEPVVYKDGNTTLRGFITYNASDSSKKPAVLVVPEWWGLNDYVRGRAKQLAELGYVAMSVDMYGDGKIAADPKQAMAFAGPFYQNPQAIKPRFMAAYDLLKANPQTDTSRIAAIGYCFGGYVALNAAKMGAGLADVVTFHGGLGGVAPDKSLLKAKLLILHGGADNMVSASEVAQFKKSMDSIGASYTFKVYPGATHAFTNPASTEAGKKFNMPITYNAQADSASWKDMKDFFKKNL